MSERSTKRLRGSYAKLICLRCRERRIKCLIPGDVEVDLSGKPQPPDRACERCRQRGLDCIVRRTTLGRPAQRSKAVASNDRVSGETAEGLPPHSPTSSDLVLLDLEYDGVPVRTQRLSAPSLSSTNVQPIRAITNYLQVTSGLLTRDPRLGSSIVQSANELRSLESIVDEPLAQILDQHLVWLRLYMPWLPRLSAVFTDLTQSGSETCPATRLLIALLALIALEVPSSRLTPEQRLFRGDLQCIVKNTGREVLLTVPRHRHTVDSFVLLHTYRPFSLIDSHLAAVRTWNGMLYPTLISAVQQQLGMDLAAVNLREFLERNVYTDDAHQLILDTIQWCMSKSLQIERDLSQGDVDNLRDDLSEREIERALDTVSAAIDRGFATISQLFAFHFARCRTDIHLTLRKLTKSWSDLTLLAAVVDDHEELCNKRRSSLEHSMDTVFCPHGKTDEALAVLQVMNMENNYARAYIQAFALFFAIVTVAQDDNHTNAKGEVVELSKYYSSAVREIEKLSMETPEVWMFLDRYGDLHMEGLERKLSDFITLASEVQLDGVFFMGPPRHTAFNMLLACKDIVENNAVRIRLDGELHPKVDMQLILLQEAARRLEGMEVDGGSAEAIARGSMFTSAAKLIRSLHRILAQWKKLQMAKQPRISTKSPVAPEMQIPTPAAIDSTHSAIPDGFMEPSGFFSDDFFADWDNWPQLNAAELEYSFPFDP